MQRQVVLVDQDDKELGTTDIYEAHRGVGKKHRALSVILYRKRGGRTELLLQRRSQDKPVFKRMWSNTSCTNMRPGDTYLERAVSRLDEEMGIKIAKDALRIVYRFSYDAPDTMQPGWCENELDTVIVGEWDGEVFINQEEADDYKWIEWNELKKDIEKNSGIYAPWYIMIINDPRFAEEVV